MVCIYCGVKTQVINSRPQKRQNHIWRRRECQGCRALFTTSEAPDFLKSLSVRRKKVLQPFSRDKLFLSVHDSLKHRKTAINDATGLTDTIIGKLYPLIASGSLDDREIVLVTVETLDAFEPAAATYYRAYHPVVIR